MIELNIPNVLTVAIVSLIVLAAVKWGLHAAGLNPDWI
jgi:hypothetical protein